MVYTGVQPKTSITRPPSFMLIKSADDKSGAIAELKVLLAQAPSEVKPRMVQALKSLQAGIKGERDAAFELNFFYPFGRKTSAFMPGM